MSKTDPVKYELNKDEYEQIEHYTFLTGRSYYEDIRTANKLKKDRQKRESRLINEMNRENRMKAEEEAKEEARIKRLRARKTAIPVIPDKQVMVDDWEDVTSEQNSCHGCKETVMCSLVPAYKLQCVCNSLWHLRCLQSIAPISDDNRECPTCKEVFFIA